MNMISSKIAVVSLLVLSACGSDDVPLPAELSRRSPVLNSAPIGGQAFSAPSAPGFSASSATSPDAPYVSLFANESGGFGGNDFEVPEPPAFIGSSSVQQFSAQQSTSFQAPAQGLSLPVSSPVDLSAAEMSATGLPNVRRAPAFNAANLGVSAPAPALAPSTPFPAQAAQLPTVKALVPTQAPVAIQVPQSVVPVIPEPPSFEPKMFNAVPDYPQLAQIPQIPEARANFESDSRVQDLRNGLNAANEASTSVASLQPLPNQPIYKIQEDVSAPSYSIPTVPSIPQPFSAAPVIPAQPAQQYVSAPRYASPSSSITELRNLRPIGGSSTYIRSSSGLKDIDGARHSNRSGY